MEMISFLILEVHEVFERKTLSVITIAMKGKKTIVDFMHNKNIDIQHVNNAFIFMLLCFKNKQGCRTRFFDDRNHLNSIEKKICHLSK